MTNETPRSSDEGVNCDGINMDTIGIFRNQLFKKSEVFIRQQAESLIKHNIHYIGRKLYGEVPENSNYTVINKNNTTSERLKEIWNVISCDSSFYIRSLENKKLDLIHCHFSLDGIYALNLANKKNIPLITTLHGFDVTTKPYKWLFSRSPTYIKYFFAQRELKNSGNKFLCVSEFIYKSAINNGFNEEDLIKHYIGIDLNKYKIRDKNEEQRIILHVARLVEKKGTSTLISAISSIIKKIGDYKLVIIGEGPLQPQLIAQTKALGLENNIVFLGAQSHNEVMQWMRKASMLVLPSITAKNGDAEGLGMVLLEAAATGVPVIGTKHGGIPEVVQDSFNGFLVNEKDPGMLSERILYLINNEDIRNRMGIKAREIASHNFNINTQTEKLEVIYQKLIHG